MVIPAIRNPDVAACFCPEAFPEGKPYSHHKCEGCDRYSTAVDELVYQKQGQWFATHIGCGMVAIGPFDMQEEALEFQKITLAPLATEEQIALFIRPSIFDYSHHFWLSVAKWYQGKVWYLVRSARGRIMPEDRYVAAIKRWMI